jgi:hypothetical protein
MTPDEIVHIEPRRVRVYHIHHYRRDNRLSYAETGEQLGITRNTVAGAERDYRRWYEADGGGASQATATAAQGDHQDSTSERVESSNITPLHKGRTLLKACVFDIETTGFSATGLDGILVCCSFLPLDAEKPYTLSLDFSDSDDRRVVNEVIRELNQYDILIGHYITGYDLPWLSTRYDMFEQRPIRRWLVYDTYFQAKAQRLKTDRKSLAFLVDHFNIEGTKTAIYPRAWHNIRSRKQDEFDAAHNEIVSHCELDVMANRNLFDRLIPKSWALPQNPFKVTFWAGQPTYREDVA